MWGRERQLLAMLSVGFLSRPKGRLCRGAGGAARGHLWGEQRMDGRAMAWVWGPGERQQGLRDGLGSGKILGTTSEFALSQHRNEALVNLRLLWLECYQLYFWTPSRSPRCCNCMEILSLGGWAIPLGDVQGHHEGPGGSAWKPEHRARGTYGASLTPGWPLQKLLHSEGLHASVSVPAVPMDTSGWAGDARNTRLVQPNSGDGAKYQKQTGEGKRR